MRARHKAWADPFLEAHPDIVWRVLNPADPFFQAPLVLEVGAGKGDFLIALALRDPATHFLALERVASVAAVLAKKALEGKVGNLRLALGDFDALAPSLSAFSFERIYLNFPDPWPKKRQGKRRLVTRDRLTLMAGLLASGGRLCFKTDQPDLYAFALAESAFAPLTLVSQNPDDGGEDPLDAKSEYEKAFRAAHVPIGRLVFGKKG